MLVPGTSAGGNAYDKIPSDTAGSRGTQAEASRGGSWDLAVYHREILWESAREIARPHVGAHGVAQVSAGLKPHDM